MRATCVIFHHLMTMTNPHNPRFVFFGTPDIAVVALQTLHDAGFIPALIITAPDARVGRGLVLTPSPAAQWAEQHAIPTLKPTKLSDLAVADTLRAQQLELGIVVAYGKIIPKTLLDMLPRGTLNMHPSLLPRHRGPSPIESQILTETSAHDVGVSIMLLDEQMDHGPVLAQEVVADEIPTWPMSAIDLRALVARRGAQVLTRTLPAYIDGTITPTPQDDTQATYCTLIAKEDAHIDLQDDALTNYRKICAYAVWPRAFFFAEKNGKRVRVVITHAHLDDNTLIIERVIPEGKKEMSYSDFMR